VETAVLFHLNEEGGGVGVHDLGVQPDVLALYLHVGSIDHLSLEQQFGLFGAGQSVDLLVEPHKLFHHSAQFADLVVVAEQRAVHALNEVQILPFLVRVAKELHVVLDRREVKLGHKPKLFTPVQIVELVQYLVVLHLLHIHLFFIFIFIVVCSNIIVSCVSRICISAFICTCVYFSLNRLLEGAYLIRVLLVFSVGTLALV